MRSRKSRALVLLAGVLTLVPALAACKDNSISGAANSSGASVVGGIVERIAPADRKTVLTVSGPDLTGAQLSSASYRGKVVVLNYWGSWCGPCKAETPDLKAAWEELKDKDVQFLGLDSQESATNGAAYMQANGLAYPSLAWNGGTFLLQLKGKAPSPPTTIVLDQQGRLAARVVDPIDKSTLVGMVDDVLAGK